MQLLARIALIATLLACSACDPADPVSELRTLQERGRYGQTVEPLRELLKERPEDPELHFLYGVALSRTGQPGLALWSLRRAREDERFQVAAGLELASGAFAARSYRVAEEAADAVMALEPDNLQALRLRAEARLEDRANLEGALADFDAILSREPADFAAQLSRFATLLVLERATEAEESLALLDGLAAEQHLPDSERARLCVARAIFAKEKKEFEAADEHFNECLAAHPSAPLVIEEAIAFYEAQGRTERSTEILRAALDLAPEATAYRVGLASRLHSLGQPAEAEQLLREGTALESETAAIEAWSALTEYYVTHDNLPAAVEAFERAGVLAGAFSQEQILAFADLLAAAEMNERALQVAQDLNEESYRQLVEARVLLNQHRPRAALELFKTALELWPNNPVARYYAARAAEQSGDFDAAIEQYRQSIRAGAEATDAGLRLAKLQAALGDTSGASAALGQHLRAHPRDPDATLFAMEMARRGKDLRRLRVLYAELPPSPLRARAAARMASAAATRGGPQAAIAFLRSDPRLDLRDPRDAEALRVLVLNLVEAGEASVARAAVKDALSAHPEAAAFHGIHGLMLERMGGADSEVDAAYQRAAELDAQDPYALEALARRAAAAGDLERAHSLCNRLADRDPADPAPALDCAAQLASAGKLLEAETRLDTLLREVPWSAPAALALARLQSSREAESGATLELAQRAVRFRGGPEARAFLDHIQGRGL